MPDAQLMSRQDALSRLDEQLPGGLLTSGEVAAMFRVDPRAVRRWFRLGLLDDRPTPGGVHRATAESVKRLLERHSDGPE